MIAKSKVLLVEDDQQISDLLCNYLTKEGFETYAHHTGLGVLDKLKENIFDIIILDWMLPEKTGLEICELLRKQNNKIPILMLTAKTALKDKLGGFQAGADDYLTKPFEPSELVARMHAIIRRAPQSESKTSQSIQVGNLSADLKTRSIYKNGNKLTLTDSEFDMLVIFMKYPGEVLTRDQISMELTGREAQMTSRSLDILLSRLRARLKDADQEEGPIRTVWGKGYLLMKEV